MGYNRGTLKTLYVVRIVEERQMYETTDTDDETCEHCGTEKPERYQGTGKCPSLTCNQQPEITELASEDGITVIRGPGTQSDWVVHAPLSSGPAPSPVEVWLDHTDEYKLDFTAARRGKRVFYISEGAPDDTEAAKERVSTFMHALANEVDAVNISADRTGAGYHVHAWILQTDIEMDVATDLAGAHGFTVYGKAEHAGVERPPSSDNRTRIRFETEA